MIIIFLAVITFLLLKINTYIFISSTNKFANENIFERPDTTEVYILGVVHKETAKITYDSLFRTLERIKPNIILIEGDSSRFDKSMVFKPRFSAVIFPIFKNLAQSNLEEIVVKKYEYLNHFAIIRPYEWELRDYYHEKYDILNMPKKVFKKIHHIQSRLNKNEKKILTDYNYYSNKLEKFGDSCLFQINCNLQDSIAKKRQDLQYKEIKTIIENNYQLKEYRNFYKINSNYWDLRNKAMSKNIIYYVKKYPKSKIVVITGYYHRYYLRDEMSKVKDLLKFKLMNY